MEQTPFSNKCQILADAISEFEGDENWEKVIREYDLGYYFAFGAAYDMITLGDKAIGYVEESWVSLCDTLGIDSYGNYETLEYAIEFAAAE